LNLQWQNLALAWRRMASSIHPQCNTGQKNLGNRTITLGEPEIDHCCSISLRFITEAMNCKLW
jgi:hypothetical protein